MKKILTVISLLLCVALMFSGCSNIATLPEAINNIVSNISNAVAEPECLNAEYNGRENYYYSSLNTTEKAAYTKIYNAYMNCEPFTVNVSGDRLEYMFNCVLYDNPEIFWVGSTYSFASTSVGIRVEPAYRLSLDEIPEKQRELNDAVNKILISVDSKASDFSKEKFFHDYICKNTVYDISTFGAFGDSVYSVFIDGRAICEGYSRAMKMLLDAEGIYNYLVIGNTENDDGQIDGHMWNVVAIENDLYHIDVTWDDCDGELGQISYLYFNLTDDDIRKDHFDIVPYETNCNSNRFNYYNANGLFFNSFNNFKGMAKPCADNLSDDLIIEMRFANYSDYVAVKNKADHNRTDSAFFDFTDDIARKSGKKIHSKSYLYNDKYCYLCIVFEKG